MSGVSRGIPAGWALPAVTGRRHLPEILHHESPGGAPYTGEPPARLHVAAFPAFPAARIPFGNRLLTMISVWLGAERRADSPRFDTLAGDAGPGFGRATHATQNKALAQAYRRG